MRTTKGYLKVLKKNDLSSNLFRLNEILVRINENIKVSYFFYFLFFLLPMEREWQKPEVDSCCPAGVVSAKES